MLLRNTRMLLLRLLAGKKFVIVDSASVQRSPTRRAASNPVKPKSVSAPSRGSNFVAP